MIVKNEESRLGACLASVADLVDEMVVVDTGSTDRTKEIAAGFKVRLFDFAWVDDFSAARNEALRHATGEWIFWLDADDLLDEENRGRFKTLVENLPAEKNVAFEMKCRSISDVATGTSTEVSHVRLFPRHPEVSWHLRVHEQVLPDLHTLGFEIRWTDVVIQHLGYQDFELRQRKMQRDLGLLHKELLERPDDPFVLFFLGWTYQALQRLPEAIPHLRQALELSNPEEPRVRKGFSLLSQAYRQTGQPAEALGICRQGRQLYPRDPELLFEEGLILGEAGNMAGAESVYRQLLETPPDTYFSYSVDPGIQGYKTRFMLALVYNSQQRFAEAEAQLRAAVQERSDFLDAWLVLGQLYQAHQITAEVDRVIEFLEAGGGPGASAATINRGKALSATLRAHQLSKEGKFMAAREELGRAILALPDLLWARMMLCDVLLTEGRDFEAAEQAMRDILAIDPRHAMTRQNLAELLRRQGRLAEAAQI
jgi:tetratricopeptide (TPR) repeat protein